MGVDLEQLPCHLLCIVNKRGVSVTATSLRDKRDVAALFRQRLDRLLQRSGQSRAAFAAGVGVDRSALTQMLSGQSARLPRAETLARMASVHGVSLDWLVGISHDEGVSAAISPALELEEAREHGDHAMLEQWHREAVGTKIRYVPTTIPDLLRTDAVIGFEVRASERPMAEQIAETRERLALNRRPETDMEVCMPVQTIEAMVAGHGVWKDLPADARQAQLARMATLVDELYPGFRLFLYDAKSVYSAPYTVFGPFRVAVYVGDLYLVLNAKEAVRAMTRHFDQLIRAATVQPHEAAAFLRDAMARAAQPS